MLSLILIAVLVYLGVYYYKHYVKKDDRTSQTPPQEVFNLKPESITEVEETVKECQTLNGKVVWEDTERKLYFEGDEPMLLYKGEKYTFSCQPYEPMAIINSRNNNVYIHNAFYPDEDCKCFTQDPKFLVNTITGKHHNAERFCRLLTTAIDNFIECQINEVENKMQKDLVMQKGISAIQFETRDFKCDKILYEGVYVMLGHFETPLSKEYNVGKIYSIAFGFPNRNEDYFEYYLISKKEYDEFMLWPQKQQWKDKDMAFDWHKAHLAGKKQVLCNEFRQNPATYKPFFTLEEIPDIRISYS